MKTNDMKTFADIKFNKHLNFANGVQGLMFFNNGYGVSVINGKGAYVLDGQYELAVLIGDKDYWKLTYNTPITDNVIGYLSELEVTEIMIKVQQLTSVI